jgi:triacylglycerol lipase
MSAAPAPSVREETIASGDAVPGVLPEEDRPRHPVVLLHGVLGFVRRTVTRLLSFSYFQGVEEHLVDAGVAVRTVALPASASVEARARALGEAIERLGAERVNVVAHSMGGLDARWYVGRLGGHRRVASLTTIATPHRGTYLADWGGLRLGRALAGWRLLSELGIDSSAFVDLRRDVADERNAALEREPAAPTFSYGAARRWWGIAAPLQVSFRLLQRAEGPNDGLVSVASARHGEYLGTLDADHLAQTGWHWTPPGVARFDHLAFYRRVVRDLARRGF